jgi:phage terminase large subunit
VKTKGPVKGLSEGASVSAEDKEKARLVASVKHWRNKPVDWVHDKFPTIVLSTQQKWYFEELGKLIRAKIKAFTAPGTLTEEEQTYAAKIGISIDAGQGVGKDFIAALTILYFLDVFPYPKITATGVTGKHLRNVLWAECSKIMRLAVSTNPEDHRAPSVLEAVLTWQTEKIFHKGAKNPGAEWFAEAVTINPHATEDDQAKTLYGRHADYQLIVVDEAYSVPEPVFGPLEGTLTGKCCIALMIANPTKSSGYAYDSQHKNAEMWITGRWNAEESELVTPEHLAKMARYPRDSNTYRVKVLGLPPLTSEGGFIPYDKIMEAVDREFDISDFDPVMGAVDAGGGGDNSVVTIRQGPMATQHKKKTHDPDELADWSSTILLDEDAAVAFVDNIGLGWYLPKALINRGVNARKADSRSTKDLKEPDKFYNKRAEMYWDMCQAFINGAISIENDEDLINCLGAVKFEYVGNPAKIKMPDKRAMKKEIRKNSHSDSNSYSPDESDSLAMTYYKPDSLFRRSGKKKTNTIDFGGIFLR